MPTIVVHVAHCMCNPSVRNHRMARWHRMHNTAPRLPPPSSICVFKNHHVMVKCPSLRHIVMRCQAEGVYLCPLSTVDTQPVQVVQAPAIIHELNAQSPWTRTCCQGSHWTPSTWSEASTQPPHLSLADPANLLAGSSATAAQPKSHLPCTCSQQFSAVNWC
jgi:hypothetical protein